MTGAFVNILEMTYGEHWVLEWSLRQKLVEYGHHDHRLVQTPQHGELGHLMIRGRRISGCVHGRRRRKQRMGLQDFPVSGARRSDDHQRLRRSC
ncbi:hypothetical protein L484_005701 [Morus notabilis]|uniref:Uncharacterized protein n=1 Tax=Morus notabilis TaxID=981085 RepID=W9QHR0_9ROSA|nr:hypothetical protein L484_005701 [Morus notabilis]